MRIVAGRFGGRVLKAPKKRARPTTDRVREAWFSRLAPRLPGARVLDLFAGSGALGLEALSRGAHEVTFVERGRASLEALRANIAALDVGEEATVIRADALRFAGGLDAGAFDVVLADPPYDSPAAADLVQRFLQVPFGSILCVEHSAADRPGHGTTYDYGETALTFVEAP